MTDPPSAFFTIESLRLPIGDVCYEARLHYPDARRPRGAIVMAPPHPFLGGNFDNNVVTSIAGAFAGSGFSVLTYNLPGVGKTTPRSSGGMSRETFWQLNESGEELQLDAEDFLRIRDYLLDLAQLGTTSFHGIGYSYGGAILWEASGSGRLDDILLISPPESLLGRMRAETRAGRALCLFAEHDLAFGEAGSAAANGIERPGLDVQILEGADHFFRDHLDAVSRIACEQFGATPENPISDLHSSERS